MKYSLIVILAFLTCWTATSLSYAQETLQEKRERADQLFDDEKWLEAEPLYASVIANRPRDYDLNFRYGACLVNGSRNIEDAISRLLYASTSGSTDIRVHYFLGRAYHLNYQFNEALSAYKKFQQLASPKELKDYPVEVDISACNSGKKLLANVTDMVVISKSELGWDSFYDLYDLSDIGGTLLITDEFQSKLDKKMEHRPVIHFPAKSPYIYYSSYGEDGETGLDIYVKQKLPGGDWSLAQKVRGQVNTNEDEAFAYMHPNGQYLYFCSKGHNSMGGYDVFRSQYNPNSQSFGPPENMDFAISSPDDDLLFVVDSLDRNAYFSSSRESKQGNLTVYQVRVERIPMQMAIIKGSFFNQIEPTDKEISITITDFSSGREIGTFNSKKSNGDYLITLPKRGKYIFTLEAVNRVENEIPVSVEVDVPARKEFLPWSQKITLVEKDGMEQFEVTPLGTDIENATAIMAQVYREMSKLPPNADDFNLDSLDALKATDEIFVEAGLDPYTTKTSMEAILKDKQEDLQSLQQEEEKQLNIAYNLAEQKSDEANALMVELNELLEEAENQEGAEKTKTLEKVIDKKAAIEEINDEAQNLLNITASIEEAIAEKEKEIATTKALVEETKGLPDGDRAALTALVQKNQTFIKNEVTTRDAKETILVEKLKEGSKEQRKVQELSEEISNLNTSKRELQKENEALREQIKNERKKKVREELENRIQDNESDILAFETEIASKTEELDAAMNENKTVRDGLAAAIILKDENDSPALTKSLSAEEKQAIENKVSTNDLTENLAVVDEVLESNNVSAFNIDLYGDDEKTSTYSLSDWNEAIDEERQRLQEERLTASEEKQKQIDKELERLEKLRAEKEAELTPVETDVASIEPTVESEEILPGYQAEKESLDEIVNEADRREADVELNNRLIQEIQKEKKKLKRLIEENPKAKNLEERLDNLNELEKLVQNENKTHETWLAANDQQETLSKEDVIVGLDADYQQKVNEAWEIIDENERNEAITSANEIIMDKARERVQELNAILDADPANEEAQEELTIVERLIDDLNADKSTAIVAPEKVDPETLSKDVPVSELVSDYDARMEAIEAIEDAYDRQSKERQLNQEVLVAARDEMERMNRLAEQNPESKTIVKRQKSLTKLEEEFEEDIADNDAWLAENKPEVIAYADASDLALANGDYQIEIDKIDKLPNAETKTIAIQKLNQETLEKIEERLSELSAKDSPSIADNAEIERLNQLKTTLTEQPNQALLPATTEESINSNPSLADVMPGYDDQLAETTNADQSEKEELQAKIDLNQRTLELIDGELDRMDALKLLHPDKLDKITERENALKALKSNLETNIDEDKTTLANTTENALADNSNDIRPAIEVGTLMPDYDSDLDRIQNSDETPVDKIQAEIDQHEMLLAALDWKEGELIKEKEANPAMSEKIDTDLAAIEEIRQETETRLEQARNQLENSDNLLADNSNETTNNSSNEVNTDNTDNSDNTDSTDNTDNTENTENNAERRTEISIGSLLPEYESEIRAIRDGNESDVDKMKAENELSQELMERAEAQLEELKKERNQTSDQEELALIDQDILKVENIKRSTLNKIRINDDQIAQLGGNIDENRPEISIGELMPDYDTKVNNIEDSELPQAEKLARKNELNEQLLKSVATKIEEVQEDWEDDPTLGHIFGEELDKLEELQESIKNDISQNEEELAKSSEVNIVDMQPTDFDSEEGQEVMREYTNDLAEINEMELDIESLESAKAAASDKEIAKIDKKIAKLKTKKAKLENEVIEELGPVNAAEVESKRDDLTVDQQTASNSAQVKSAGLDELVQQADQDLETAAVKMNQAKALRKEAADEKDPVKTNELLNEAIALEEEAKDLTEKAQRVYRSAVLLSAAEEPAVITEVSTNENERASNALYDEAAALREMAADYYNRATELRDSAETVKKKYRSAVLLKADEAEAKGKAIDSKADQAEKRGDAIAAEEEKVMNLTMDPVEIELDEETTENVATSEAYEAFYQNQQKGNEKLAAAKAIDEELEEANARKKRVYRRAVLLEGDPVENIEQDEEYQKTTERIDSLKAAQRTLRDDALASFEQARDILNTQSAEEQENMMALATKNVAPRDQQPDINPDFEAPEEVTETIFRSTENAVYNEKNPIPVDQKTSGLVYKVQVGAFRNPLPQDHFKEFAPISGEKLPNGITRFMVGYFNQFDAAQDARNQIRPKGYPDAYVVAYCNGERISTNEAKQMEAGLIACEGTLDENQFVDNTTTADNSTTNDASNDTVESATSNTSETEDTTTNNEGGNETASNSTESNNTSDTGNETTDNSTTTNGNYNDQSNNLNFDPKTDEERTEVAYYRDEPDAAPANQVEIIEGLFYTVQIGVYSKPVPNSALFNIQPLNSQRTESGYIRYSTGIFHSEEEAIARRDEVREIGITDAFVTAYYNGERITTEEALEVLRKEGADVLAGRSTEAADTSSQEDSEEKVRYYKEGLYYKILIGKYDNAIPGEFATLLLQTENIFQTEVDEEGRTCLLSTKIESHDEMVDRLREFADLGIEDMEVLTYYKYDVIPYEQGQKIRNDEELDGLNPYEAMKGISADSFIYNKEAVYFKLKLGEFENKVPSDFANLLLLHEEEENIYKEETIDDLTIFYTGSIKSYEETEAALERLKTKGFENAIIIAYHKYDEISVEKALEILEKE